MNDSASDPTYTISSVGRVGGAGAEMTLSKTNSRLDYFRCGRAGHMVGKEAYRINEESEQAQDPQTFHVCQLG